jgi:hypothetical protein
MQFTYPYASIKDVQATGEACSPQKRTSSTSKMKFINFFLSFVGHLLSWIRIRIANPGSDKDPDTDPGTLVNPDPGPQHCNKVPKSESKTKKSSSFRKDRGCTASDIGSNLCVSGRWPCQRRRGVGGGEGRSPSRAATRSRSRRW